MPRWLLWTSAAAVAAALALWTTLLAPERIPVKVVVLERGRVESTVANTKAGTVRARRRAQLSSQVGGRVVEVARREGDWVEQGAPLIALDGATQRAQLRLARESLRAVEAARREACIQRDRARRELERKREAYISGINTWYHTYLADSDVDELVGEARFVDAHTLEVAGKRYTADHIVIASGGRPTTANCF